MRIWVKGLGVTLLVSAVACSSGSGGGGSVTSVPGNTSLATLTPAQATQICTDSTAYASRLQAGGLHYGGDRGRLWLGDDRSDGADDLPGRRRQLQQLVFRRGGDRQLLHR